MLGKTKIPKAIVVLVVGLAISATDVVAQSVEPPSIGEMMGERLSEAMQAAQDAAREKAAFEAQIRNARNAYFSAYPDGSELAAAEDEFARLLYGKDYYYLLGYLLEGTTETARARVRATDGITGGALDGGIANPAWPAFERWVDHVRRNMGASRRGDLVVATDPERIAAAIDASTQTYRAYKAKRDESEFRKQGLWQPPENSMDSAEEKQKAIDAYSKVFEEEERRWKMVSDKAMPGFESSVCWSSGGGMCDWDRRIAKSKEIVAHHLPGLFDLTVTHTELDADDRLTQVTREGECVVMQATTEVREPNLGAKYGEDLYLDSTFRPVHYGRCWVGDDVYGIKLAKSNKVELTGMLVVNSPHDVYLSDDEPDTIVFSRKSQNKDTKVYSATTGKMVRKNKLVDLRALPLEGRYKVTVRKSRAEYDRALAFYNDQVVRYEPNSKYLYGAKAFLDRAKTPFTFFCSLEFISEYDALNVRCEDELGVEAKLSSQDIRPGLCRDKDTGLLEECLGADIEPREFFPWLGAATGGAGYESEINNLQWHMNFMNVDWMGKQALLGGEWLFGADPRQGADHKGDRDFLLQIGEDTIGDMVRIGDLEPSESSEKLVGEDTQDSAAIVTEEEVAADTPEETEKDSAPVRTSITTSSGATCTLKQIAGTYDTAYGKMVCGVGEDALNCCYSLMPDGRCPQPITLQVDTTGEVMKGPRGNPEAGHVEFGVADNCNLSDGRHGNLNGPLSMLWQIRSKLSDETTPKASR